MNRYDLILGLARDIATNVHADPAKRDAMADDLIKLCTAVASAVDLELFHEPAPWGWCACGHGPGVHSDAGCIGEQHNRIACEDGPCPGFRAVQAPTVWTHVDRRPAYFRDMDERGVLYIPPELKPGQRVTDLWGGACVKCGQTGRHANSCPTTKTIKDGS